MEAAVNITMIAINFGIWHKWGIEPVIVWNITLAVIAIRGVAACILTHAVVMKQRG